MPAAHQEELPLQSALAHAIWPGRSMLKIKEVVTAWDSSDAHVINLIECGDLLAIDIRTSKPAKPSEIRKQHLSVRQCLRIPVSAHDAFVRSRKTL